MAENESGSLRQERNVDLRFNMRSVTSFKHKGKVGLAVALIVLFALTLSVGIPYWSKLNCHSLSSTYKMCNGTLANYDKSVCYNYGQEKGSINRFYRKCASQPKSRCKKRALGPANFTSSLKTFIFPPIYDHVFFSTLDADSILYSVYVLVNNTCILNARETSALLEMLE